MSLRTTAALVQAEAHGRLRLAGQEAAHATGVAVAAWQRERLAAREAAARRALVEEEAWHAAGTWLEGILGLRGQWRDAQSTAEDAQAQCQLLQEQLRALEAALQSHEEMVSQLAAEVCAYASPYLSLHGEDPLPKQINLNL